MSVPSARSLPEGHRCDRGVLDADPCQIGDGQIIVAGASLHDSFQKLAQSDRVLFAPHAAFDRVMELPGARCLAPVVDRDDRRTSEHVGSQLLLRRVIRTDGGDVGSRIAASPTRREELSKGSS